MRNASLHVPGEDRTTIQPEKLMMVSIVGRAVCDNELDVLQDFGLRHLKHVSGRLAYLSVQWVYGIDGYMSGHAPYAAWTYWIHPPRTFVRRRRR